MAKKEGLKAMPLNLACNGRLREFHMACVIRVVEDARSRDQPIAYFNQEKVPALNRSLEFRVWPRQEEFMTVPAVEREDSIGLRQRGVAEPPSNWLHMHV